MTPTSTTKTTITTTTKTTFSPAKQASGNWIKGMNGQNCDQVCGEVGKMCNAEEQSSLDTKQKVAAAFLQAGYTCKSFHRSRRYPGTPFSTGRRKDDCAPMRRGKKSVCHGNQHRHHAPLCYCQMVIKPDFFHGR